LRIGKPDHTLSYFPLSHLGKTEILVALTEVIYPTLLWAEWAVKENFDEIKKFWLYQTSLSPREF
jgi:hypothetical protein